MSHATPSPLAQVLAHPERVAELAPEAIPPLLVELAGLHTALAARLATAATAESPAPDRLLPVDDAAALLSVSSDFLYRSPAAKALRVRVGGRVLFSSVAIQQYIRRRTGR